MGCESETIDLLRESGHKMTPQRMMILTSLRHASGHLTAAEIFERVRAEYPYVDKDYRSTYYNFYSKKSRRYSSFRARLHFFREKVTLSPTLQIKQTASETLKSVDREDYHCAWCAAGYAPVLDEIVEVTFTLSRRVRRIAAHDPHELPFAEYFRQIFWGSGIDVPEDFEQRS